LIPIGLKALPPTRPEGLTVNIWSATRPAPAKARSLS
jgi:hypothetical protein